jgi:hypothetical protein
MSNKRCFGHGSSTGKKKKAGADETEARSAQKRESERWKKEGGNYHEVMDESGASTEEGESTEYCSTRNSRNSEQQGNVLDSRLCEQLPGFSSLRACSVSSVRCLRASQRMMVLQKRRRFVGIYRERERDME